MWGIGPDAVNRVPSNADVNHIRYSLNHGTKLATNYVEVGYPLKVVPLASGTPSYRVTITEDGLKAVLGLTE